MGGFTSRLAGRGGARGDAAEEFMLVESSRYKGQIPSDLSEMVPNMKIPYIDAESSRELKNRARVKR